MLLTLEAETTSIEVAVEQVTQTVSKTPETLQKIMEFLLAYALQHLLPAILIGIIGMLVIRLVGNIFDKYLHKSRVDDNVLHFLDSCTSMALKILLILMVISRLGVASSTIIAVLGSAGLAIGLALQGSLSNFAGGVLILLSKPFLVGDYIITNSGAGFEGTVKSIDMLYTRLLTIDNRSVVIPNGTLSNSTIINATAEGKRRIDLLISIDYDENIKKVKDLLLEVAKKHKQLLKNEEITVYVNSFDPSAISIGLRMWVATENYWTSKWEIQETIKREFDKHQIVIPYDKLDVNINQSTLTK